MKTAIAVLNLLAFLGLFAAVLVSGYQNAGLIGVAGVLLFVLQVYAIGRQVGVRAK